MPHPGIALAGAFSLGAATAAAAAALLLGARRARGPATAPTHSRALLADVRYVPPPHPSWRPGDPQPPPFDATAMHTVDPAQTDKASVYPLVISAVVPRPVAFVSSLGADGSHNLAPYSYFNTLGHNPPIVAIGICRSPGRGGGKKDTLQNIEETGEFVVNIISDWFVEAANHTCGDFARGEDEMALAGLTPVASQRVAPPRVGEAAVAMECKLLHVYDTADSDGKPSSAVVLGQVLLFHVADAVAATSPSGKLVVDPVKLRPVCRLGGVTYGRVSELYNIPRPDAQGHYPPPASG